MADVIKGMNATVKIDGVEVDVTQAELRIAAAAPVIGVDFGFPDSVTVAYEWGKKVKEAPRFHYTKNGMRREAPCMCANDCGAELTSDECLAGGIDALCGVCLANIKAKFDETVRKWRMEYAEARHKYPYACESCNGAGGFHVPGNYETPPDYLPCDDCVLKGLCPRCNSTVELLSIDSNDEHNADCEGFVCFLRCGFDERDINGPGTMEVLPDEPEMP